MYSATRHIKTDPVKISIRGGRYQKPKLCYQARPISALCYAKGKSIFADLEVQGLIVYVTEASEFCSPCSGDEFGQRLEIILSKYPKFTNFLRVVDDIAVFGKSKGELEEQFLIFLDICRENHLTLSPKKFQMCDPDGFIKFAGMILSSKGLSSDTDKMSAIQKFPIPVSRSDLRSWLGLCQQLSMWYPELASCQSGLWHLVRDGVVFHWSLEMTEQMEATKRLLW